MSAQDYTSTAEALFTAQARGRAKASVAEVLFTVQAKGRAKASASEVLYTAQPKGLAKATVAEVLWLDINQAWLDQTSLLVVWEAPPPGQAWLDQTSMLVVWEAPPAGHAYLDQTSMLVVWAESVPGGGGGTRTKFSGRTLSGISLLEQVFSGDSFDVEIS